MLNKEYKSEYRHTKKVQNKIKERQQKEVDFVFIWTKRKQKNAIARMKDP